MSEDGGGHVCDPQRPGDVILALRRDDPLGGELSGYGRERGLPGLEQVSVEADLDAVAEELSAARFEGDEMDRPRREQPGDQLRFWLLNVPEGQEQVAAGSLMKLRLQLAAEQPEPSAPPVFAQPNHYLDYGARDAPVALGPDHTRYLTAMGLPLSPRGVSPVRVRVIDSGYSGAVPVALAVDILDRSGSVDDTHGHGTCVADIVASALADHVALEIFRVSDDRRLPTEWEILQALSVPPFPPVINLSLSVGFVGVECTTCGRQPQSARTAVFEWRLRELADHGVLVVASAGNGGQPQLAFPSRFDSCIATEAWSGDPPALASYSNHRAVDQADRDHPHVFLCPGGDRDAGEGPVLDRNGSPLDGTSYATAYMTGLLASLWDRSSICHRACDVCRDMVLDAAEKAADPSVRDFDPLIHGHGMARV